MIDWRDESSRVFINPRSSFEEKNKIQDLFRFCADKKSHIFLSTSGSTQGPGEVRLVALSKEAVLASAQAVNHWIEASSKDIWFQALPFFHIGGLSIWARAYLSSSVVIDGWNEKQKWHAEKFVAESKQARATLTSLVPTQIFDLVEKKLTSPTSLRVVFVGGSFLSEELYLKARELGWPLLPTYGCSECSSQIASANLQSLNFLQPPELEILPHWQIRKTGDEVFSLSGPALFSGYVCHRGGKSSFIDPKTDHWFELPDKLELKNRSLRFMGRGDDFVKILGEGVNLVQLNRLFENINLEMKAGLDAAILAVPDKRNGHRLVLVGQLSKEFAGQCIENFNKQVRPFEILKETAQIERIPRNALGKVLRKQLLMQLGFKP